MRFYKIVDGTYIVAIGTGNGGTEITAEDYNAIKSEIANRPQRTETTDYRLKDDLTWEAVTVEPPNPNLDIDDSEAYNIIFGGDEA